MQLAVAHAIIPELHSKACDYLYQISDNYYMMCLYVCTHYAYVHRLRKNSPKKPYDYVRDMHKDYLFKICKESGLSGLDYFGGPQVACTSCDWEEVVPCVVYKSGDVRQVEDLQACSACGDVLNIEEWLVSANMECHLFEIYCYFSP